MIAQVTSPAPGDTWARLVADDPDSMLDQAPAWVDAICASGPYDDASRLYELADGRRFVLPLVRRRGLPGGVEAGYPDGWGIGGLVGPGRDDGAIAAVLADLAGRREVFTRLRPDPLDGHRWRDLAPAGVVTRPRRAHVLDLRGGPDAVWSGLNRTTRKNVRRAERGGLDVTSTATPEHLDAYYRLFELSLRRWAERSREPVRLALWRGRRRDPLVKLQTMARLLGERFRLWLAWQDGEAIAGSIVLRGNAVHVTRGAMDVERAGPARAMVLLDWLAIQEALDAGSPTYHFGETGTSTTLGQFKEGFGARPHDYHDVRIERLPFSRADLALRTGVKRLIGFRDA